MIPCHPAQKYGEEGAHNRVLFVSGFIRHHGRLPFPDAAHRPTPSRSARSSRSPGSGASPSLRRSDLAASSSLPSANFVSKALELLATADMKLDHPNFWTTCFVPAFYRWLLASSLHESPRVDEGTPPSLIGPRDFVAPDEFWACVEYIRKQAPPKRDGDDVEA
eukprot:Polyplicarium_translucidae@DN1521_c0_g1_i2.p1